MVRKDFTEEVTFDQSPESRETAQGRTEAHSRQRELQKQSPRDSGAPGAFEEWLKKVERKEDGDKSERGGGQVKGRRQTEREGGQGRCQGSCILL